MRTMKNRPTKLDRPSLAGQFLFRQFRKFPFFPSDRKYRLTVSKAQKFVWFRVPKVCSRTIYQLLKESADLSIDHSINIYYPVEEFAGYFKFAFVRNPWDWMVAVWHGLVVDRNYLGLAADEHNRMRSSFDAFIDWVGRQDFASSDHHIRPQTSFIDLNNVDYLGRYETFASDLDKVFRCIHLPLNGVPRINRSSRCMNYRSYYTAAMAAKVGDIYRKDVQLLNYRFDESRPLVPELKVAQAVSKAG